MEVKNFNNWINESSDKSRNFLDQDFSEKLYADLDFTKNDRRKYVDIDRKLEAKVPYYLITIKTYVGEIKTEIEKLLDLTGFDTVPDLIGHFLSIKISIDESLNIGEYEIKKTYEWDERHRINVIANPRDYNQLKSITEEALDYLIEKLKDVRLIAPSNIKKIEGLSSKIIQNVKDLYDNLIDEFYNNPSTLSEIVDKDILSEIFTKTLLENPQYIESVDKLPISAKKRIFHGFIKLFNEDNIEINEKNLKTIKNVLKTRKIWKMI